VTADNLGWILPVSAAVQAIATVVLVGITARYVRLTRHLVTTGQQQLSDARAILEAQAGIGRVRLLALATRLLDTLEPFSAQGIPVEQLRRAAMWVPDDEHRFFELATALGSPIADKAADVVRGLTWVRLLQGRITSVSEGLGYGVSQKEGQEYVTMLGLALNGLRAIVQVLTP
jgi:hypothetical protein